MVDLTRTVARKSSATVFEKSKRRDLVMSLEAPGIFGVRVAGTRDVYRLDAEAFYSIAVKFHADRIERRAKQIAKTGVAIRSARSQARKELKAELKSK